MSQDDSRPDTPSDQTAQGTDDKKAQAHQRPATRGTPNPAPGPGENLL